MAVILFSACPDVSSGALPIASGGRAPRSAGDDPIARLMGEAAGARTEGTRTWPQLRYADLTFRDAGETLLPSLASPLIIAAPLDRAGHGDAARDTTPAGTTIVLRAGAAPCRYAWPSNHRAIFISLDASLVATTALETGMRPPSGRDRPASIVTRDRVCTHLLQVLTEEARVPIHAGQRLLVESVARALAVRLLAHFTSTPTAAMAPGTGELAARRFARVQDYIEHHLGDAISLEDMARVAGVSRFHFARQFRARTGESPMSYLLRTRVERAKMLLRETEARVVDISAELGFADQSHFARMFRRIVGVPPSAYARVIASATSTGPP